MWSNKGKRLRMYGYVGEKLTYMMVDAMITYATKSTHRCTGSSSSHRHPGDKTKSNIQRFFRLSKPYRLPIKHSERIYDSVFCMDFERKTAIQAKGINLDHLIGIVAAKLEPDFDSLLSTSRQITA